MHLKYIRLDPTAKNTIGNWLTRANLIANAPTEPLPSIITATTKHASFAVVVLLLQRFAPTATILSFFLSLADL